MSKIDKSREERLADYWYDKLGTTDTRFHAMLHDNDGTLTRDPLFSLDLVGNERVETITRRIGTAIYYGQPLTFVEFHLAIAAGLLLTEMEYEEFYKKRWFETDKAFGYGGPPDKKG